MISEEQLDKAAVKAIDSMNRLMFAVDIEKVASNEDQTAYQRMNQIRRFEMLWRQRLERTS